MARFASDCLSSLTSLTRKLEVELGPDTTDLGVRVGIHSGPVTAGVLRGERARFQLFGDTMVSSGDNLLQTVDDECRPLNLNISCYRIPPHELSHLVKRTAFMFLP